MAFSLSITAGVVEPPNGDASRDTAILQRILDVGGVIEVSRGIYRTNRTLRMSSGTTLKCDPGTVFKPVSLQQFPRDQLYVLTNQPGAHDLIIENCTIDASDWPGAAGHHAFFFKSASRVRLIRPRCLSGPGDCTAMVHTRDTVVEDGSAFDMLNACWDHWDGSTNMRVTGGQCRSSLYGAMITGTNTIRSDDSRSSNGVISGGSYVIDYRGPANAGAAIWINGLGRPGSGVSNVQIVGPRIRVLGNTTTAIEVSGASADVRIIDPVISGEAKNSAIITGEDSGGTPRRTTIKGAIFDDVHVGNRALVTLNGENDTIDGSVVSGGSFSTRVQFGKNPSRHR